MAGDVTFSGVDARGYVDGLIARAVGAGASDLHLEPLAEGVEARIRVDGMLKGVEMLPADMGRAAVLRLMVMAQLLTYRLDIPQEGRVRTTVGGKEMDLRLAIMPVGQSGGGSGGGLRAVVRLPAELHMPRELEGLGLPARCLEALKRFAKGDLADGGGGGTMLLVTGPAGSGKTTTIYALLEYMVRTAAGQSIISLEDPIERLIGGVTQIEVTPQGQMTYERALKSILRQDPQVLMLGEVRDVATARLAVQAALTGHRLIATMHASEPAGAIARLLDMGIEPYQLTSSLFGVMTLRLLRKRGGEGYAGRVPVGEFVAVDGAVRTAVLARADAEKLRKLLGEQAGYETLREVGERMVREGVTDAGEVGRVLGG